MARQDSAARADAFDDASADDELVSSVLPTQPAPGEASVARSTAARLIRKVARRSIQVGAFLLDVFPAADNAPMQVFRPDADALRNSEGPSILNIKGGPRTRTRPGLESFEGRLASGEWESFSGRHDIKFDFDEWVYVLEGSAEITIRGVTRSLKAGDCALFRAGIEMSWNVPQYIRKVWVHRYSHPNVIERGVVDALRLVFAHR